MLKRLGNVFGWIANVLAILAIVAAASFIGIVASAGEGDSRTFAAVIAVACVVALVVFLIGRAARYILVGSK